MKGSRKGILFRRTASHIRAIVAVGFMTLLLTWNLPVSALSRAGDLDPSFDGDGKVTADCFPYNSQANAIAVQPDGKVVAAGFTLKTQPDDKIVLGGYAENEDGHIGFALARYNADGSLDQSFGGGGKVSTHYSQSTNVVIAVTIQADGKIVAAGYRQLGGDYDFAVARYKTNGGLDSTFGDGGMVVTKFSGSWDIAIAVTIAPDGRILVGGYGNLYHFAVACYLAKGTPNITGASVSGKKLYVHGTDFDEGAAIYLNGVKQKTKYHPASPETDLIGKKAGKKIAPGQTVMLHVRCADGRLSNEFRFTWPVE